MKNSYLSGLRRAIWQLRYRSAAMLSPVVRHTSEREVGSSNRSDASTSRPESLSGTLSEVSSLTSSASKLRVEATTIWLEGDRTKALRLLRRALRKYPLDSLLWMSLGQRLQELGLADSAYFAYINAVEIDPGNFVALEQFIAIAESQNDPVIVNEVLSELPAALKDRPHRHLESLDFSIPYGIDEAVAVVEKDAEGIVADVAKCYREREQQVNYYGTGESTAEVELRTAIVRDDVTTALRLLPSVSTNEIPGSSLRRFIRRLRAQPPGGRTGLTALIGHYLRVRPDDRWIAQWATEESGEKHNELMLGGYDFSPQMPHVDTVPARDTIAYLAYNSLPYHSAGYSTRTHSLLKELRRQRWKAFGVTRLGYPHDMPGWTDVGKLDPTEVIDGVPYLRLSPDPEVVRKRPVKSYVDCYVERLVKRLKDERPAIIHAASNHLNGLAAVTAARILDVPSIYEVRGLWEVTRGSRDPIWATGPEYRSIVQLETDAAKNATRIVTITGALRAELVRRGVAESKITVIPNGVDTSRFLPAPKEQTLADDLGIGNRTVIGYVGSIVDYEGLGLLVEATAALAKERDDFVVVIVGDGADAANLISLVEATGAGQCFRFVGRVSHDQVEKYYSLIDIAPFPRLPLPVCEMVSPLKPFEAMAMQKAVVASNVDALAEIITDGVNGILFTKGDVESLAGSLRLLLDQPELRRRIADSGRAWVEERRQWSSLASKLSSIYESLGARRESHLDELREASNESPL